MSTRWIALAVAAVALASPASGQSPETVGVVTEIKLGAGGTAEVGPGGAAWRPAAPLQALRAGDAVRVSGGAVVVVLLSGGRGTVRVDAAHSPLVLAAAAGEPGKASKAASLVAGSIGFLTSSAGERPRAVLSTRGATRPPDVLTPRRGPVLPGPLVFEWVGSRFARYTVRVFGPSGVVFERQGVVGARLEYPADAPPLRHGVSYRVEVTAPHQPPREAAFEVLDDARAAAVRRELQELERSLDDGASPSSLAAARAGYLASTGLLHDARLTVLAALAHDPDEPVLHALLANLYTRTGLPKQAAEAAEEAEFLLTRGAK